MGLFMATAVLATIYTIAIFGPKLSLQNKIKAMKAKMKEMMLAHNNQIISQVYNTYVFIRAFDIVHYRISKYKFIKGISSMFSCVYV
jgi:hypothetical protein